MAERARVAEQLFERVMAPLVLGGALRPLHAIGARTAIAIGETRGPAGADLASRVRLARVRCARRLFPLDTMDDPAAAEWTLCAALNDVLQAANPAFDAPMRRRMAARILESAAAAIERVPPPSTVREALSRHTWFARLLDVARTDTTVSWWLGSRGFHGADPPQRLRAWPELRRVSVLRAPVALVDLTPLAVDRARLHEVISLFLQRTPLTDLATCARASPTFAWSEAALGLVATNAGRTLALRAIARLDARSADAALTRATRDLLARKIEALAGPALALEAERAIAKAQGHVA